jgi:sentrin-specific protease 1
MTKWARFLSPISRPEEHQPNTRIRKKRIQWQITALTFTLPPSPITQKRTSQQALLKRDKFAFIRSKPTRKNFGLGMSTLSGSESELELDEFHSLHQKYAAPPNAGSFPPDQKKCVKNGSCQSKDDGLSPPDELSCIWNFPKSPRRRTPQSRSINDVRRFKSPTDPPIQSEKCVSDFTPKRDVKRSSNTKEKGWIIPDAQLLKCTDKPVETKIKQGLKSSSSHRSKYPLPSKTKPTMVPDELATFNFQELKKVTRRVSKVSEVIVLSSSSSDDETDVANEKDSAFSPPNATPSKRELVPGYLIPSSGPQQDEVFTSRFALSEPQRVRLHAYLKSISSLHSKTLIHSVTGKYNIFKQDLLALIRGEWLNDEMIMGYLSLVGLRCPAQKKKIHLFNTFFYTTLKQHGFPRVRRWLKRPASSFDLILIPINFGNLHWALATVEYPGPQITMYDSSKNSRSGREVMGLIEKYLESEFLEHSESSTVNSALQVTKVQAKCPQQLDGRSCGVFTVAFATSKMLDWEISEKQFSQPLQSKFRQRMAYELIGNGVCGSI